MEVVHECSATRPCLEGIGQFVPRRQVHLGARAGIHERHPGLGAAADLAAITGIGASPFRP